MKRIIFNLMRFSFGILVSVCLIWQAATCFAVNVNISTGGGGIEGISDEAGAWLVGSGEVDGGDLIQVIKTSDGLIHEIVDDPPNYLSAFETLVASTAVGEGFAFDPNEGKFSIDVAATQGDLLYIRAFNYFDIINSTHYGNSEIHTVEAPVSETWNINGSDNIPAFQTNIQFDFNSPGLPTDFVATAESTGDISLSWTNTTLEVDLAGTVIRFRNDTYPTDESNGTLVVFEPGSVGESENYLHTGLTPGLTYYYSAFSSDEAGNYSEAATTSAVSTDLVPPTVEAIVLSDRSSGSSLYSNDLTISIEASVLDGATQMLISDESTDSGWIAYENPTEFTLSAGEGARTIYYMVRDGSLNESNVTSETIIIDTISPDVVSIEVRDRTGDGKVYTNEQDISIEAFGVSAEATQMMISESSIFAGAVWISLLNPSEFTLNIGDGAKTVYYKVRDPAENESPVRSDTITLDTTGPIGTVEVNGGAEATNEVSVTLTIQATDEWAPIYMKVSNNSGFSGASWEPFAASKPWSLSGGEGLKTVYAKFMDAGSNESGAVSDTIIYDISTPEIISITVRDRTTNDDQYTNEYIVDVYIITSEATPYMMISDEASLAGAAWQPFDSPTAYTITIAGDGTKEVFAKVSDVADNISDIKSDKIILDTVPPSVLAVSPLSGSTGESATVVIYANFDDELLGATVIASNFKVWGSSSGNHACVPSYNSSLQRVTFNQNGNFDYDETVICTVETGVQDKAHNPLASRYTWVFETLAEPDLTPPVILDFMIDGKIPQPGDVIAVRPNITAKIWDMPGASPESISRIELDINAQNILTWVGGAQYFNNSTGDFNYTANIAAGVNSITLRAYDLSMNPTEESFTGLRAFTTVALEDVPLNYPNPFSPLKGQNTYFGYTLLGPEPPDLDFIIYDITGSAIWRKRVENVELGLHKYKQYSYDSWDGRTVFGDFVGNGIYILKIVHGDKAIGTAKITVLDMR